MSNEPGFLSDRDFSRLLRLTLENARDMIFWVRADGSFLYVNPAVSSRLGYSEEELYRLRASDILTDYDAEERRFLREEIQADGPTLIRATLLKKDGSSFPVESNNQLVNFEGEAINCAVCRDITGQLHWERQIQASMDRLENENRGLRSGIFVADRLRIVGTSRLLREVLKKADAVAASTSPVLITGETGTGKESLARYVHANGGRRNHPLFTINCGTLTENDIISNLFGHAKGAYTGAAKDRIGLFGEADGATLFLDEVGELTPFAQTKLLRVIQQGTYQRMGENKTRKCDVRLITATNRQLTRMVSKGTFREDLFYRLAVLPLKLPPLRHRRGDIPLLVEYQLAKLNAERGRKLQMPSSRQLTWLKHQRFPGNIRQLFNIVERAFIFSKGKKLNLGPETIGPVIAAPRGETDALSFDEMASLHIRRVLDRCYWKIEGPGGAAEVLGLKPGTLRGKMRRLGIRKEER